MADKYWWEEEYSSKAKPGNWWETDSVSSTVGKKITDSVNSWLQNHKNYVANYQYRTKDRKYTYEDDYVSDPNDWLNTVSQQKRAFDESADSILAYMDRYKGFLDAEWVKSVQDTLASARGQQEIVVGNATADSKWWRNFANEEEYKTAQRYDGYSKKYTGQKYDDIQKALSLLDDGEEKWWLSQTQYDLYKGDGAYTSKADSGLKSFEAQKIAEREQEADKTWWERVAENYANSSPDTSLPAANLSIVTSGYRNDTSYREPNEKWSDGERRQFGYLYAEDPNKAYAYAEQVNNQINAKEKYAQQQAVGAWAGQNFGTGTAGTIGAFATAPMGLADFLDDMAEYAGRGTITQKGGLSPFEMGQAAQSGVANKLNEKYGTIDGDKFIFGGKGWGDVYSLGVSAANSLLSAYTLGGTGTLVNFIGQGGAAGVDDALSRGATPEQALLYGTIVGAAEGVTEMINADNLLKVGSSATLKNYLLKALNQGIGESIEEGASSLIGNIADNIIMQDKSNFYTTVQQLMEDNPGMSEEEAKNKAWVNMVGGMVFDAMGGFATGSGNAMLVGGASTAWDARKGNQKNIDAVKQYGDYTADLIQEGLQSDKSSESYQLAEKYQKQTQGKDGKSGKAMTGFQIRNLVAANDAQFKVEDFREVRNQAKDRLKELGENASEMWPIAELVAKRVTGQELTRKEKSTLARSQFGAKVAKEMTESAKQNKLTYKSLEERIGTEGRFGVSENGQATVRGTDEAFDLTKAEVVQAGEGQMTFMVGDKEVSAGDIDFADESQSFLVSAVSDIENITPAAANAVMRDIVDTAKPLGAQLNGIDEAYTYGFNGYSVEDLKAGDYTPSLTDKQMMSAYKLGQAARKISDVEADAPIVKMRTAWEAKLTAKQKIEQQKARIESDDVDVYFEDGGNVVKFDEHTGEYDDKRMTAVNTAKFLSKLGIGGKYYFFESYENAAGERVYKDANGNEVEAPNGIYREADGSIHIDLNAGDAGQGTAAYTLGHELGHFVKHQSKKQFKILGDLVTEAFDKTDVSMHDRVVAKQDFLSTKRGHHVTYSEAFEEVVADAMSTMITDGTFHEKIMEIKVKDKGLFNTIKRFFEKMISKFRKAYADLTPDQKDAQDIREMKEIFDKIQTAFAEALVEASDNFHAAMESVVETKSEPISADEILTDGAVVTDGNGEKHSIRSMKHDIAEGKMFEDLKKVCGWTDAQVVTLRNQLNALVEYMIPYRDIIDMNESYGMEGRRFSPYKPNSDPLYKISMDFSTLCSKRLLTQYVIENLQLRENRPMSAEEQMAIRDMLNEYRKVEKGLQVACAMCYVEAARLKSPKQMQRWLDDPAPLLKDYFGKKNKAFNDSVKEAQADFKESKGYDREAPKKDMKPADVKELNKIGPKMRSQYQLSAEEQAIVDRAKTLPSSTYLTAGNLANLSETDPVIYDAYTAFVRTATRSKSLETDEPYYYGDSMRDNGNGIVVTDSFIEAVNRENGMRFSSWSDWRIQHLLDYITAVIDNSVRGAAMHGYTKFGEEVRVLGKTGMMFNMSGVAGTQTGLNKDGSLNFSDTESIDVNEAIQLRNEFPETAGLQCIGVGDDHITALLRSDIIDYVIPYHVSGLNAALRRMADIHGWKDYTSTQHAAIDKSIKFDNAVDQEHWHEEPVYSEFFVGYDTGMTGIEAMRASAEKYKQMCKDRGLTPKFNQFASEENYWKLLIDRKMINQQTGNLIKQRAVTPTFDFDTIKEVVDRHVQNYDAGLEKRALNHIVENWDTLPQRIKDLKKGNKAKKSVDTLANQTVAAMPKDTGVKKSDRQKWKPNLDSTEWGIVKYTIDSNQGTAITSTCNMFFKKSKGRTLFGIYSTDDSTLLYASREKTAERERLFLEQFLKEYENGNVTDTSAEGLHTWAKAVRVQQNTSTRDDSTYVAPGRSAGDAAVYGRPSRLYSSAALRNVLENIFQKETAGRTGDGVVKNSDRDSTGKELTKEQQEYFADSKVRDKNGNLLVMYHGSSSTEKFTVFERRPMVNGKIYGDGYYFTEEKNEAQKWGSGNLYKVYVDLKNPYYVSDQGEVPEAIVAAARENYGRSYDRLSQDPSWWGSKLTREEYIEKNSRMWRNPDIALISAVDESGIPDGSEASYYGEIARRKTELLRSLGYDGVIVATNRSNKNFREVMAFDSEQIKLTTNKKPTADKDIRYSERSGESVSNRHLLANAFEGIVQNSIEYKLIQEYKDQIKALNKLEEQLSDTNAEIRKLTFGTDGERDSEKLNDLRDKAKRLANDINRHDKKLLSLEASEPLRKVIDRERAKASQKTKDHVKEIQQNKKVRAEQAELRHKIRKAVRDLDKILKHGNKQKNVKEDLQPVVTKALKAADILFTENYGNYDMLRNGIGADLSDSEEELVNTCTRMLRDIDKMPTDGYDSWQARQEAEKRLSAKMAKLKDVFARERKRLNNTTVSSILGELADAYASLKDSEQGYVQGAYMEPVHEFLKSLQSEVGGAIVKDMTKDQLESVYAAYKMVLTTVRKANELFNKGIKMSREQLGNAVIAEVMKAGGTHGLWTKGEIARSQADWNNTKPVWVANRIGSESFGKLMQGLFEGQYNFAVDIEEAKQFKLSMDQKYHPRNWDSEKLYHFESSTGKKFSLNLQQIMSIYAFSKREQAYSHLLNGGFVFEGNSTVIVDEKGRKKTYIHNGAASYKLNEVTLNEIIGSLTKEQKSYVDEMQAYLSDVMGAKGNEVSMKLYGIQMFKEKFYFPLRSSGAYMERAKEAELKKQQGQINLVNSGFTHAVKPEAKNPIILAGFMDVWAEHCNEMSMYHSMVLPMEDFRKVYNYSTVHDDRFDSASVYQTIQDAYGKAATDYIDQLYRELNAGATVDPRETPFKARISKFKKAAVMLSASVVVQQFSSVGRAYALIDPKYFIGTKVNSGTSLSAADEMKKYAPVAIIKEMGGFDTGTKGSAKSYIMAEQYGKGERIQGFKKDEQYRSDLMGILPAKADEKTWCAIWEAVKRETKANHPKMDVKSEEFLKLAGDRFSEVIEKTQVYDSVLARSANMRSKSAFMAMATSFMAEPTTTVNLLEDALRGRSVKKIARAFGAVAVSIVLNNALASVVYAMRDDDEDETFIEKYFQSFASGMIDDINPMSYYPFLKDVYSLFQGYDVERADMSVIADLRDAMKKAVGLIGKDTSEMDEDELVAHWKNVNSVMMSLLDAGCSAFGVPLKNVRRDGKGLINAFKTIRADITERDTTWTSFWDKVGAAAKDTIPVFAWTKDRSKQDKLYEAILKGDTQYVARLKSGYKTDDAYHSAIRKLLRENDPRIHEAAQAKYNGNSAEYKRIFKEIQKEGKFSFDDIMESINSELNAIKKEVEPASASSNYSSTDFVNAIVLGETSAAKTIRDDILDAKVNNGDTREEAEETFASSVATATRNAFDSGLLDAFGVAEILTAYAGMDDEEADGKINYWSFVKAHPQYRDDLTQSNVEKYHEFAEPAEIPLDVYVQYVNGTKGLETIRDEWGEEVKSKREQVLEVIDSLDLTWRQKDALYLAAGYAESKIMDVPW